MLLSSSVICVLAGTLVAAARLTVVVGGWVGQSGLPFGFCFALSGGIWYISVVESQLCGGDGSSKGIREWSLVVGTFNYTHVSTFLSKETPRNLFQ